MKRGSLGIIFLIIIFTANIPFLIGFNHQNPDLVFSGFVINPVDGNSYLAKMQQGYLGSWEFYLPFTSNAESSSSLFLFYIFLGHVARWLGLSLLAVFHVARLAASVFLLAAIWKLSTLIFDDEKKAFKAFVLASVGSGMGWTLFPWGIITADFWVMEAFPFLSLVANPHFIIGLTLMIWLVILYTRPDGKLKFIKLALLSSLLAIVMPFGCAILFVVVFLDIFARLITKKTCSLRSVVSIFIPGGLLIGAQYAQTVSDPFLRAWNNQNITTSPAVWDLLISLSPSLLFALWVIIKKRTLFDNHIVSLLVCWLAGSITLMYLPFNFQRRFMFGIYIPAALLSVVGIERYLTDLRKKRIAWLILIGLSCLTNVLFLFGTSINLLNENKTLFITQEEHEAFDWINQNTPINGIILASPETGNRIPAFTGRRVVYGHPFETVDAEARKSEVNAFFNDGLNKKAVNAYLAEREVNYVFWDPEEKNLGQPPDLSDLWLAYKNDTINIFAFYEE